MEKRTIVVAGATGNLGGRIARELLAQEAQVRAIVRHGSAPERVEALRRAGASIVAVDFNNLSEIAGACHGGSCVVSALSGLREAIVDAQTSLLEAAVKAGVTRFIPSDYAIDFTKLPFGTNRNLDLRKEFLERLNKAPIAATSILNGMFADLLTGEAPMILFRFKRVVYYENANQLLDFTTMDNSARFIASAALDDAAPRILRIAGEQISANGLAQVVSEVTGENFRLLRAGGLKRLAMLIKITRALYPKRNALYPPWQGMQYVYNMFSGQAKLSPLDNDRYPGMQWTPVRDLLAAHHRGASINI
jgi:nucleoside-diphosphate-sugar epimerase